ncbi:MAG: hypothetical protein JST64_06745 [Actinobacteria bacterium]|nr:hypothetical protein [Actinomycetota bacterium]
MVTSVGFRIVLLVHVLAAVVAFGGNFIQPMLQRGGTDDASLAKVNKFIQLPAIVVMFLAGIGAVMLSKTGTVVNFKFDQMWISIAFLVAIVAGVLQFLVARAYEKDNAKIAPALTGGLHLCLVVGLVMMIWKPGFPS